MLLANMLRLERYSSAVPVLGLFERDPASVQADLVPAQPADLAGPHAGGQRQHDDDVRELALRSLAGREDGRALFITQKADASGRRERLSNEGQRVVVGASSHRRRSVAAGFLQA
jgi:hypothetical protein